MSIRTAASDGNASYIYTLYIFHAANPISIECQFRVAVSSNSDTVSLHFPFIFLNLRLVHFHQRRQYPFFWLFQTINTLRPSHTVCSGCRWLFSLLCAPISDGNCVCHSSLLITCQQIQMIGMNCKRKMNCFSYINRFFFKLGFPMFK